MTVRELYKQLEENGALDFEIMMNCNLEPMPVHNALIIRDLQFGPNVYKNIVVLDN